MATVKYKQPSAGMNRMIVKPEKDDRLSIGMTEIKGEIYYLSPDIIIPYKNQARKDIKQEALLELAASIKNQGIIQPLQIIPSKDYEGKFEVVSGERRLRAAKEVGLKAVPCMILDRDRDHEEIALIENIQREDLHPIELADAVNRLVFQTKHGDLVKISDRVGIPQVRISQLLSISRLPEDIKQHLLTKPDIKIKYLRDLTYLKDEKLMRERVFQKDPRESMFRSILRLSYNGNIFRTDQLKINQLNNIEKDMLKDELSNLIMRL